MCFLPSSKSLVTLALQLIAIDSVAACVILTSLLKRYSTPTVLNRRAIATTARSVISQSILFSSCCTISFLFLLTAAASTTFSVTLMSPCPSGTDDSSWVSKYCAIAANASSVILICCLRNNISNMSLPLSLFSAADSTSSAVSTASFHWLSMTLITSLPFLRLAIVSFIRSFVTSTLWPLSNKCCIIPPPKLLARARRAPSSNWTSPRLANLFIISKPGNQFFAASMTFFSVMITLLEWKSANQSMLVFVATPISSVASPISGIP